MFIGACLFFSFDTFDLLQVGGCLGYASRVSKNGSHQVLMAPLWNRRCVKTNRWGHAYLM
jgi:hypothetical protein